MTNPADIDKATSAELYGLHTPATGSGLFFALKDGETKRVRFQSDPYVYEDHFTMPDGTDRVSTRYAWIIWNHDEKKAQILKQSGTFYSSVATLASNPDFGDPVEYDVHIARTGTGTDTKYTVNGARKNIELDEAATEAVAALDIFKDAKESVIMPFRDYLKAGSKFIQYEADGVTPIITELPEGENPLDKL